MIDIRPHKDADEKAFIAAQLAAAGFPIFDSSLSGVSLACGITVRGRGPWDLTVETNQGLYDGVMGTPGRFDLGDAETYEEIIKIVRYAAPLVPGIIAEMRPTPETLGKQLRQSTYPDGVLERIAIRYDTDQVRFELDGTFLRSFHDVLMFAHGMYAPDAFFELDEFGVRLSSDGRCHVTGETRFSLGLINVNILIPMQYRRDDAVTEAQRLERLVSFIRPGVDPAEAKAVELRILRALTARTDEIRDRLFRVRLHRYRNDIAQARAETAQAADAPSRKALLRAERRAYAKLVDLEQHGLEETRNDDIPIGAALPPNVRPIA